MSTVYAYLFPPSAPVIHTPLHALAFPRLYPLHIPFEAQLCASRCLMLIGAPARHAKVRP